MEEDERDNWTSFHKWKNNFFFEKVPNVSSMRPFSFAYTPSNSIRPLRDTSAVPGSYLCQDTFGVKVYYLLSLTQKIKFQPENLIKSSQLHLSSTFFQFVATVEILFFFAII